MSTAKKWFVSDGEYWASVEDYAVVGRLATQIQRILSGVDYCCDGDCAAHGDDDKPRVFQTTLEKVIDYPTWAYFSKDLFAGYQLLYLDVDCKNPEHQKACRQLTKEDFLDEELESTKQAREKIIDYMMENDPKDVMGQGEEGLRLGLREWPKDRDFHEQTISWFAGHLQPAKIDYIMGLKADAERDEALKVLSCQGLRKSPRPVGVLISVVDDLTSEEVGKRTGWVAAYHLRNDTMTIKRFLADETHHPFSDKWVDDLPNDGICFHGRPSAFVAKLVELREKLQSKKDALADPQIFGHRLLVYFDIAQWFGMHWKALASLTQVGDERPMTDEDLTKIKTMLITIYDLSSCIEFSPTVPKAPAGQRKAGKEFRKMQATMEKREEFLRKEAIALKEAGQEIAAQNAASLYGETLEKLKRFNMDPEKPL
ncbi:MAG: hypothetical protein Q9183_007115 [Haloplaca sp. 2 TL-2023]